MRGCFEMCLLIIFFSFFFCVCLLAGVSPLLIPPMHTTSRTLFFGVQRQRCSRAAHRPPNSALFRRKRPVARPRRRPWLGSRPSPAAASIGPRARGPPSSRAPRGPASVGGIRVKPFFLGFNVSSIRARLTARRIPRHFVVKGLLFVRGGALYTIFLQQLTRNDFRSIPILYELGPLRFGFRDHRNIPKRRLSLAWRLNRSWFSHQP